MAVFVIAFFFSLVFYLFLTAGSGNIVFWAAEELLLATVFAALTGLLTKRLLSSLGINPGLGFLNPVKWILFTIYLIGPLFFNMAKANIDVAYRVITGKIKPGIVKISPGLKTGLGMTILANSITLTPGTLSVDIDKDSLYVHWINIKNKTPDTKEVCGSFAEWVRRLTE